MRCRLGPQSVCFAPSSEPTCAVFRARTIPRFRSAVCALLRAPALRVRRARLPLKAGLDLISYRRHAQRLPTGVSKRGGRNMSGQGILVILLVGLIAGWLAGKVVRGTGYGVVADICIGIVGALLGSWLFSQLGIRIGSGIVAAI